LRRWFGRAASGYRRTAVAGLASVGIVAIGLSPAFGQEQGRETGQESPAAAFSNGTAKATAVVARVAPGVGSLELGISSGVAVAEIKNTIAQAQAEALDLGLIGSTLTSESCSGDAPLTQDQLPQASRVDSRGGDTALTEEETPIPGSPLKGGRKHVEASTDPAARAISTVLGAFGGLLTFDGGTADAVTRVVPGEAREAHAQVSVDLDIGGLVQLSGMRWEAFHRTGKDPEAEATFDVGTAALLGVPFPLESLDALEEGVNGVLAPSGVTISFPKVERFTEPADLMRISPMRILLKDSPAGAHALGPVLNLTRVQREQLFDQLAAAYCQAAGVLLVGDIGVSVVSGTGFLAVEIGGAEATTGELVLEDPFGDEDAPAAAADLLLPTPAVPGLPNVAAPPVAAPPVTSERTASIGPLEERCESAHPLRKVSCSRGALMALGVAGVLATLGMGALDWNHQRRRAASAATGAVT
jgi:hypothetical protein